LSFLLESSQDVGLQRTLAAAAPPSIAPTFGGGTHDDETKPRLRGSGQVTLMKAASTANLHASSSSSAMQHNSLNAVSLPSLGMRSPTMSGSSNGAIDALSLGSHHHSQHHSTRYQDHHEPRHEHQHEYRDSRQHDESQNDDNDHHDEPSSHAHRTQASKRLVSAFDAATTTAALASSLAGMATVMAAAHVPLPPSLDAAAQARGRSDARD
jgi:hypothetical protein